MIETDLLLYSEIIVGSQIFHRFRLWCEPHDQHYLQQYNLESLLNL
mgnify:CR=1 FL=1